MHGLVNENNATPISHITEGENSAATPPTPAPRNTVLQTTDENEISQSTSSVSESSSDKEGEEASNVAISEHSRSGSQGTVFDEPWDREKSEKDLLEKLSQHSDTSLTSPSPYETDGSEKSLLGDNKKTNRIRSTSLPPHKTDGFEKSLSTNSEFKLQKNRFWPKAQYAMQQKGVIIFGITAIAFGTSAALVCLQDKAKFIAFFANSPLYTIIPVIAIASLLVISSMFLGIKQFVNTKEYQNQGKNADEVLGNVLKCQPENKAIKSVRLEYSNGTHSNFVLNAWESKKGFVNIDEKVISKTNKIKSIINNRPIFTTLLTGVVALNISFPLLLYVQDGVNNTQRFYRNPLTNNIGLSVLIGSGIAALLVVYLGVHYYRKTNCTNLIYSEEMIDPKNINGKFIEEIKRERTNVLEENHSKDAKRSSLMLEQVIVQSHNYPDVIYGW
ncbi:hypothetical protein Wcon_00983 [Wolbachia endosymbiont of Cylisticus convexus]|uniref:hypothetical protein n=1 Tax=Wolbachia endosymbiont of Cylisticus convexus TaxID=118728 RepID=UPI000DF6D0E2|nr:hypothetical protein [Wolbachia endosymbiont of Cylisticus convexus]RDD34899.1 hypothetical protein Wcon_00983 [Wolbachia endosymbiont of Cylisticus convexus]